MPRSRSSESNLKSLVEDFVQRIVTTVESATTERVQAVIASVLGGSAPRRGPGRPPKNPLLAARPRARRPKQLCPVPGCKNPAAPVFGMVCAKHKGISKARIKKYREQRRASKQKAAA